jgi:hypothetical protein
LHYHCALSFLEKFGEKNGALFSEEKNNFPEKNCDFEPYTPIMLIMAPIQTVCAHIFSNVI